MIRLRATGQYRNGSLGLHYLAGEEFVCEQERADYLMRDSPGTFVVVEPEAVSVAALDGPPTDKMQRRERTRRQESERGREEVMSRQNMPGIVRPKG